MSVCDSPLLHADADLGPLLGNAVISVKALYYIIQGQRARANERGRDAQQQQQQQRHGAQAAPGMRDERRQRAVLRGLSRMRSELCCIVLAAGLSCKSDPRINPGQINIHTQRTLTAPGTHG